MPARLFFGGLVVVCFLWCCVTVSGGQGAGGRWESDGSDGYGLASSRGGGGKLHLRLELLLLLLFEVAVAVVFII